MEVQLTFYHISQSSHCLFILDDSWLEISSEEVDAMLKARYGPMSEKMRKDPVTDQKGLTTVLDNFLGYMSGIEGAEFPK